MKKMWKSVVGFVLVAAISSGVAVGTYAYLNDKKEVAYTPTFQQPLKLASYHAAAAENTDFTEAAEKAVHGVVHIKSTTKVDNSSQGRQYAFVDPFEYFFGGGQGNFQRPQPQPKVGSGSGVIISTDGYIITNNHVVEGATDLEVTLNDNRKFKAELIGADEAADIALIKIEAKDLPVIPFGDSEKLKVGEWVLAVGNPFNLTSTVTAGIVSAKGRGIPALRSTGSTMKIESFIQTDAAVNPGNSGGALVNTKGELVGINTAIYSETGNFAGYSFAVPISIAGKIVNDLKQYGAVQRAILGITMLDIPNVPEADRSKLKQLEGAYVVEFADLSPAKDAGMEKGDVITHINGAKVKNGNELQEQVSKYRPGDKIDVTVDRFGSTKNYKVVLQNRQGGTGIVKAADAKNVLGATFSELSSDAKRKYGTNYGVQVTSVTGGKFAEVGIKKGFVIILANDQKISKPADLERIVKDIIKNAANPGSQGLLLLKGFYENGAIKHYAIDLM